MPFLAGRPKAFKKKMLSVVQEMYKQELKSQINARFGFHDIEKAIQFYMKNQSNGKVVLKPSLVPSGAVETQPIQLDKHFAKL